MFRLMYILLQLLYYYYYTTYRLRWVLSSIKNVRNGGTKIMVSIESLMPSQQNVLLLNLSSVRYRLSACFIYMKGHAVFPYSSKEATLLLRVLVLYYQNIIRVFSTACVPL